MMEAKRNKPSFEEDREFLSRQLIRLGDMLGDGDAEPWVKKEYRRVAKALGYDMPVRKRADHSEEINKLMADRVLQVVCSQCGCKLKQIRSGSMQAKCTNCNAKFRLLKRGKA